MSKKQMTRDELRAKLFSAKKYKSEIITLFGAEIEIRQPSLGGILEQQESEDRKAGLINSLTRFCYVPGTDELVFELGDAEAILNMPFGDDVVALNKAIENLTGIDVTVEEGNSVATV